MAVSCTSSLDCGRMVLPIAKSIFSPIWGRNRDTGAITLPSERKYARAPMVRLNLEFG